MIMRLDFDTLKDIKLRLGDYEIGADKWGNLTLKFGYWKKVSVDILDMLLPPHLYAAENLVDEDEETGGELWNYIINTNITIH